MIELIKKRKSHAFGKDIYLLGRDSNNQLIWLEAASWDCGHYWGFGYIESYTNQAYPDRAKDIHSHTHYNSIMKDANRNNTGNHKDHLNEVLLKTTLSNSESRELADLMTSFYTLKDTAAIFTSGNSHISGDLKVNLADKEIAHHINQILMPQIFARIYEILTPVK